MERSTWTDARLDDRFDHIDRRFDRLDGRLDRLDAELKGEIGGLRSEIRALQTTLVRVGGGMMAGLVGVITAVLLRGG